MNKNSDSKDTYFSSKSKLTFGGKTLELSTPKIMGILNVTPDSFYDGGKFESLLDIQKQVEKMILDGAAIIDVGAYSSRPGAQDVSVNEETIRIKKALKAILEVSSDILISVDTFRSDVAKVAIEKGAFMINDISGGQLDENMFKLIGKENVPYVLMHMKGTPQTMQSFTQYGHVTESVFTFFQQMTKELAALGANQIILDPGFGFAKNSDQNYQLLSEVDMLKAMGSPLLIGVSRKSMIYKLLGIEPSQALNGTTVLNTVALLKGASILRVHDVKEARETVTLTSKL